MSVWSLRAFFRAIALATLKRDSDNSSFLRGLNSNYLIILYSFVNVVVEALYQSSRSTHNNGWRCDDHCYADVDFSELRKLFLFTNISLIFDTLRGRLRNLTHFYTHLNPLGLGQIIDTDPNGIICL